MYICDSDNQELMQISNKIFIGFLLHGKQKILHLSVHYICDSQIIKNLCRFQIKYLLIFYYMVSTMICSTGDRWISRHDLVLWEYKTLWKYVGLWYFFASQCQPHPSYAFFVMLSLDCVSHVSALPKCLPDRSANEEP